MRARRMPQIFQQALQKLAAFQTARGLRIAEVGAKIPVCPQYRAGTGLFQSGLPWGGPHVGRQGQPRGGLALLCGRSGFGLGGCSVGSLGSILSLRHAGPPLGLRFTIWRGAWRSRTLLLTTLLP